MGSFAMIRRQDESRNIKKEDSSKEVKSMSSEMNLLGGCIMLSEVVYITTMYIVGFTFYR